VAQRLNKPVTLEEFGLGRDLESCEAGAQSTIRDKYFKKVFDKFYEDASSGKPIAGLNFWAWGGEGRSKSQDHTWRVGDPLVGDPPHEPQGVYSIFNTDYSTLKIIRDAALRVNELMNKK